MPQINLLPWRDELRSERRNQFYIAMGVAVGVAGLTVLIANFTFVGIIDHQYDRNELLKSEIATLDLRIKEIIDLEDKKDRLLARMRIIEQLQRSRPGIVHVFQTLVGTMPEGVYLTEVSQIGTKLEITGAAESNTRVSAFMRSIDDSDWLKDPDLEVVEVKSLRAGDVNSRASEFVVYAVQASNMETEEELE
jgi:type IV pilus assembly protein PilN